MYINPLPKLEIASDGSFNESCNVHTPRMEFHILKVVRKKYGIQDSLFEFSGNAVIPNFRAARKLAAAMNKSRNLAHQPESAVKAGHINAVGLIDEIQHYIVELYRAEHSTQIIQEFYGELCRDLGKTAVDSTIKSFLELFPPIDVYKGSLSSKEFMEKEFDGRSGTIVAFEEMIMLRLENENLAYKPYRELFNDQGLSTTLYSTITNKASDFFDAKPPFGPQQQKLFEMLKSPQIHAPESLSGQLTYILDNWGPLLGKFLFRLLSSHDFIKEEERGFFAGPGPTRVIDYDGFTDEPERFSIDREWMPNVVLIAKSTLVWLNQLSKKYARTINTLNQIPDEELELLASQGFNCLWLIGLWERSHASRRIKQINNNPEAEASAYSLYHYEISQRLGGQQALEGLRHRAGEKGIRLASDMVPNHTGLDSEWMDNHPDWYIQLPHQPYPDYSFNGENLSLNNDVGVYLEDHYFTKEDAAVVFKRVDHNSGDTRYIYHGNDGTHMPWNDTAQLDFLKKEVREAVVQTILEVARNFNVIRFDAAMTLAKKHFRRLWYPAPGSGGDIPTRAEHAMSDEDFHKAMPKEFWREVVDRVAKEVPDTLLLAEAFWMMEGYFVRTLGMHRVYNSAFMNMLKNEENKKYKDTIKNTISFDAEILKRFVNFMNNPDEETAIAQFGKGDKYFGICTMMVTMPGLPMFGHGQIEGFTEKYGMEFQKANQDERPDEELVRRHENEIFPLMKKRHLFSSAHNFRLFDLWDRDGSVNENVFAYSNRADSQAALIIYNNSFTSASGWINPAASFTEKDSSGNKVTRHTNIEEGLSLHHGGYTIMREQRSGLWYIRRSSDLINNGMYVELDGYESQVYLNFYEVADNNYNHYSILHDKLNGKGVCDVTYALKQVFLEPLHHKCKAVFSERLLSSVKKTVNNGSAALGEFRNHTMSYDALLDEIARFTAINDPDKKSVVSEVEKNMAAIDSFFSKVDTLIKGNNQMDFFQQKPGSINEIALTLLSWALFSPLGRLETRLDVPTQSISYFDELLLGDTVTWTIDRLSLTDIRAPLQLLLKNLIAFNDWFKARENTNPELFLLNALFINEDARNFLGENRHNGILYFNKESFEKLMWWLFVLACIGKIKQSGNNSLSQAKFDGYFKTIENCIEAAKTSGFDVDKILEITDKNVKRRTKTTRRSKAKK